MLEDYQRVALLPNAQGVTWLHFVGSRFVGRPAGGNADAFMALLVQKIAQEGATHGALAGLVEFGSGSSLPVVFEFEGSLDFETRHLSLHETSGDGRSYAGRFSENGRVITLQSTSPEGAKSKPFHLTHEDSLAELHAS